MPPASAGLGVLWLSMVVLALTAVWLLASGGVGGAISCATMAAAIGFGALPGIARADKRRTVAACATVAALAIATALWALYAAGAVVTVILLLVAGAQIFVVRRVAQPAGRAVSGDPVHR